MTSSTRSYRKRSASEIKQLLEDQVTHGYTSTAFCQQHDISHQTLYNWQKKYGYRPVKGNNFIPVTLSSPANAEPVPFCELTISGRATIRFFQPIDAHYLKTLIGR